MGCEISLNWGLDDFGNLNWLIIEIFDHVQALVRCVRVNSEEIIKFLEQLEDFLTNKLVYKFCINQGFGAVAIRCDSFF